MLRRVDRAYRQHLEQATARASKYIHLSSIRPFHLCVPWYAAKVQRDNYPFRPAMDYRVNVLPTVRSSMEKSIESQFTLPLELLTLIDTLSVWSTADDGILTKIKHSAILTEHLLDREKARNLAEAMAHTSFPQRAHRVLLLAHKAGCRLKQNAYECVAFQLATKKHWHLIPSLVSLGKRQTGRTTVRLLNWHARALLETGQHALFDDVLEEFEKGNVKPNRKTFHLLISGHIRNRRLGKARECLQRMERGGFPVDASTHSVIVSVYRPLGPDSQVQAQAFEALRDVDGRVASTVLNSLMQLRIDAHDFTGALQVLSLFNQRQINPHLKSQYGENSTQGVGDNTPAPEKYIIPTPDDTYVGQGFISPDVATFCILINYMATRRDLPRGLRILQRMRLGGIRPDAGIVAAIMRAHFVTGDEGTAISMVVHMCDSRIWYLFSPFIAIPVDETSLPLVTTGIPLTIEVLNTLLKGVLNSRGLNGAHVVLRIMRASHFRPDADTVEILIAHLAKVEHVRPRALLRILRRLTSTTVRPTLNHVHIILRAVLRREKYLAYGSGWDVIAAKFSHQRQNKALYPKNRKSGIADSFDPMAGISLPLGLRYHSLIRPIMRSLASRRVSSDRSTIALRIRHEAVTKSDMETAREVFRTMLTRGMHPNEYHFSALMEGYALSGDLTAAEDVMESAAQAGMKPNVVMFTILIVGYARQGNPDLAMRAFQNMVATGIKPDIPAIDAVTSGYFAVGAYAMARRVLLSLWPHVRPLPKEMRGVPLKQLARVFRSLHREKDGGESVLSKQQRSLFHRKLNVLVEAWTKLSGRNRGVRKLVHPVARTSQKPRSS